MHVCVVNNFFIKPEDQYWYKLYNIQTHIRYTMSPRTYWNVCGDITFALHLLHVLSAEHYFSSVTLIYWMHGALHSWLKTAASRVWSRTGWSHLSPQGDPGSWCEDKQSKQNSLHHALPQNSLHQSNIQVKWCADSLEYVPLQCDGADCCSPAELESLQVSPLSIIAVMWHCNYSRVSLYLRRTDSWHLCDQHRRCIMQLINAGARMLFIAHWIKITNNFYHFVTSWLTEVRLNRLREG